MTGMSHGHRNNERDCECSTKVKENLGDKSRRKGFGNAFQLEFACFCVKQIPSLKF